MREVGIEPDNKNSSLKSIVVHHPPWRYMSWASFLLSASNACTGDFQVPTPGWHTSHRDDERTNKRRYASFVFFVVSSHSFFFSFPSDSFFSLRENTLQERRRHATILSQISEGSERCLPTEDRSRKIISNHSVFLTKRSFFHPLLPLQ